MGHETDDAHILDLILKHNRENEGYRLLMTKYQEKLYWHIRGIVKSHVDTDDVLQNTFVKVFRSLSRFQSKSQLFTWMYRIATNESITFLNRQRKKMTEPFDASITAHNAGLKADHYFDASQAEKLLLEALAILPDKQKEVFQLRYYGELTYKQMSDALGTSEGALKASFHHAVKKIEKYLIENGIA